MYPEIKTFCIMFFGGVIVGLFYDIYRYIWLLKHKRSWKKDMGDFTFTILSSVFILVLLFYANYLELRFYVFMGLGGGILTYFKVIKIMINYFQLK